jgi:hypothetical protein
MTVLVPTKAPGAKSTLEHVPGATLSTKGDIVHCNLDNCSHTTDCIADMIRHREVLAHAFIDTGFGKPVKRHPCFGCPKRFTRVDSAKRHMLKKGPSHTHKARELLLREWLQTSEYRTAWTNGASEDAT